MTFWINQSSFDFECSFAQCIRIRSWVCSGDNIWKVAVYRHLPPARNFRTLHAPHCALVEFVGTLLNELRCWVKVHCIITVPMLLDTRSVHDHAVYAYELIFCDFLSKFASAKGINEATELISKQIVFRVALYSLSDRRTLFRWAWPCLEGPIGLAPPY